MAHSDAIINLNAPFDKRQKAVHRYEIVDTRDNLQLTVPIVHPHGEKIPWCDVLVSSHGEWWQQHLTSLESAYGRTPFFEFYIDRFIPLYKNPRDSRTKTVGELIKASNAIIAEILGINAPEYASQTAADTAATTNYNDEPGKLTAVPYWQVRADRLGFRPGLSILDMIFNIGPEAPLTLHRMSAK